MAGEQFNKVTFRQILKFDTPSVQAWSQSIVNADSTDVAHSAETNAGVPRIKLTHTFPNPDTVAPAPQPGDRATDESARAYLLGLVNAFVLVRTFKKILKDTGDVTLVRAYHANVANTSPILQSQLDAYIRIPPTPNKIGVGGIFFSSSNPWGQMLNDFGNRIDLEFTYCHGNYPPPCHGSRGRR